MNAIKVLFTLGFCLYCDFVIMRVLCWRMQWWKVPLTKQKWTLDICTMYWLCSIIENCDCLWCLVERLVTLASRWTESSARTKECTATCLESSCLHSSTVSSPLTRLPRPSTLIMNRGTFCGKQVTVSLIVFSGGLFPLGEMRSCWFFQTTPQHKKQF